MTEIAHAFRAVLPAGRVDTDEAARLLAASDIATDAPIAPDCVLRPQSEDELVAIVRIAVRNGLALYPRGGGWSYTGGYTPGDARGVIVETSGLKGIMADPEGQCVTAGAGVTWAELDAALAPLGLRAPSFGPLSGIGACLGSSAAQDGGFFGAATHGPVGQDCLLSSRMVDGHGQIAEFGQEARIDPVFAPQPLAGECGAFGIRSRVVLRTIPRPAHACFASFALPDGKAVAGAMASLVGLTGIAEVYAFDAGIHTNLAANGFSVIETGGFVGDLLCAEGRWWDRLGGLMRTARAGRAFLGDIPWSLHVVTEGDMTSAEEARLEVARRVTSFGAEAIPDSIPRVTRARPFRPIKALFGPRGERWLPSHGLVPATNAPGLLSAVEQEVASHTDTMRRYAIRSGILLALLGPRITIEPQLFWPDAPGRFAAAMGQPDQLRRFAGMPAQPAAREAAFALRAALIATMDRLGAGHFQIGRTYARAAAFPASIRATWLRLKQQHDPRRIMNPGVLDL